MAIENLFNHRCSIYHLIEETTSPGWGLPGQSTFSYPAVPDLSCVPCHFNVGASTQMVQQEPMNTFLYVGKLQLPKGTDIRSGDKVLNEGNGLEFTAQVPQDIRGHHMTVTIQRKGNIEASL